MKKLIVAAASTLMSLSSALASSHYDTMYYDNIRPNGHPRPQAVYDAALDAWPDRAGARCQGHASLQGLHGNAYRWVYSRPVKDTPSKRLANAISKGHFIDRDTGLICHNTGIASICDPPPADMTIHYTSKHGLGCTVGSSRVDLQACKLEYSIVSPK